MRRLGVLLVLLVAASAGAQIDYPLPTWSTDDAPICIGPYRIETPSGAFALTQPSPGVCQLDLNNTVVRGDQIVGNVLGEAVAYDLGTGNLTCGGGNEGRFGVQDDGTVQVCSGSTASTVYEPVIATGITGGQTAAGGTVTTDTLTLNPSTASDARGAINLCANAPNVGANSVSCAKLFSGGLSIQGTSGVAYIAAGMDSTITQTGNGDLFGNPSGYLFNDGHTLQFTDSTQNAVYMGASVSLRSAFTLRNGTNDALTTGVGLGSAGLYFRPTYVSDGGSTLTIPVEAAVWSFPQPIPANVVVATAYGGYSNAPDVTGTLTNAYGWYAEIDSGTNRHPFAAKELAPAGSTESGRGDFGIDDAGLLYTRDDSQVIRRVRGTSPATQRLGKLAFDMGSGNTITTGDEWVFRLAPFAGTVTTIGCEAYAGTSFVIDICTTEDTGDDTCATSFLTGTVTCNTTGTTGTLSANTTTTANQKVTVVVSAVTGTVQKGEIYIDGTAS